MITSSVDNIISRNQGSLSSLKRHSLKSQQTIFTMIHHVMPLSKMRATIRVLLSRFASPPLWARVWRFTIVKIVNTSDCRVETDLAATVRDNEQ